MKRSVLLSFSALAVWSVAVVAAPAHVRLIEVTGEGARYWTRETVIPQNGVEYVHQKNGYTSATPATTANSCTRRHQHG